MKKQPYSKPVIWRNKEYLAMVRRLPCVKCLSSGCDAAHVRLGTDGGTGLKPSDYHVVPLCPIHHQQQHRIGEREFWEGYDPHAIAISLFTNREDETKCRKIIMMQAKNC